MEDKKTNYFQNNCPSDEFTSTFTGTDLEDYYLNPEHFLLKNPQGANEEVLMPENIFVSVSHGSYGLPDGVEHKLIGYDGSLQERNSAIRLLKNFSDFGTMSILENLEVDKSHSIKSGYSRAIGDCNRDCDDLSEVGYIRPFDFNNVQLFSDTHGFYEAGIIHYQTFHDEISDKLKDHEHQNKKTILFDLHDTGIFLLGRNKDDDVTREEGFPIVNLGNDFDQSCDSEIFDFFTQQLEYYMGVKVFVNSPYAGGYITKKHGSAVRKTGNTLRNVIQIEVARYVYMNEKNQEVHQGQLKKLSHCLNNAIKDTGIYFNNS